jgi:hypothetical protein
LAFGNSKFGKYFDNIFLEQTSLSAALEAPLKKVMVKYPFSLGRKPEPTSIAGFHKNS